MKQILFAVLAVSAVARPIVHWETAKVVSEEFQLIAPTIHAGHPIRVERTLHIVELENLETRIHYRLVEETNNPLMIGNLQVYFRDAKGFVLPDSKGKDHRFTLFTWKTR